MTRHLFPRLLVLVQLALLGAGVLARPAQPATAGLEALLGTLSQKGWTGAAVDSTRDVGEYMAVGVNQVTGKPYVSYYDLTGQDLWLARIVATGGNCGPGNTWKCQVVDSTGDVGKYSSIAVNPGDPPFLYIAYYDQTNGSLKYAMGQCGETCNLVPLTIQSGSPSTFQYRGLHTSTAYDPDGWPVITYQATYSLGDESVRVASYLPAGGGNCGVGSDQGYWQCDTIKSGEGMGTFTSIALETGGQPRVGFYDPSAGRPWYAVQVGSGGNCGPGNSWYCTSPYTAGHDTGTSMSLYLDSSSAPHLAFADATAGQLVYATYVGNAGNCGYSTVTLQYEWQCDVIDDDIGAVATTRTVAMTSDPAGRPVIAYRDDSGTGPTALMLAVPADAAPAWATPNCGPADPLFTWYCSVLDAGGTFLYEGSAVSIASTDRAMAIAYREEFTFGGSEGNLKVLHRWLDAMFEDGFESGGTTQWSGASP